MKFNKSILQLFILFLTVATGTLACKSDANHASHHGQDGHHGEAHQDHNHANAHMHKRSLEELAESFESPERMETQKPYEVIAMFGDLNGKTIMDIGAGTGYFTFKLAEKGAHVIAGDVDDQFLEFIANKMQSLNISDEKIELRKLPYDSPKLAPGEVDGVLLVNTYHHIEKRKTYFKEVYNGLKDGGMLMVVDFVKKEFEEDIPGPPIEMRIASDMVMDELSVAGFKRVDMNTSMLPYQYIIRAFKK
jgi:cyclopropane fatty-acyl-phospholipid synthase-like methyltransferase